MSEATKNDAKESLSDRALVEGLIVAMAGLVKQLDRFLEVAKVTVKIEVPADRNLEAKVGQ